MVGRNTTICNCPGKCGILDLWEGFSGFDQKTCSEGQIQGWDACLFLDLKPTIGFRFSEAKVFGKNWNFAKGKLNGGNTGGRGAGDEVMR